MDFQLFEFFRQIVLIITPVKMGLLLFTVTLGILFGALPGLTATLGVALLTSVTFNFPTDLAIVALLGIYVGAIYGGSHAAILINIPGTGAAAATCLDGYPLNLKGRGGEAIGLATISSFIGTVFGMICVQSFSPLLMKLALNFTSVEFFLLGLFGVLICGSLTARDLPVKGWIAGFLGLLLAVVGLDPIQGYYRYTFGSPELFGGIDVIPVLLGGFAIPQVLSVLRENPVRTVVPKVMKILPPWGVWLRHWKAIIRSGLIGVWVGSIPGVGEDVAAWMSYDAAKRGSKTPEKFGTGIEEGVIAPETANNSCIGGAIIPLLTLAVPGSPPAAMLLGAIWLHGVRPGPMLGFEFPNFMPQMAATLFWASVAMLIMGLCMSRVTVLVLKTPPALFMPIVTFFCVLGSYALGLRVFNLYLMVAFGVLAYFLEEMGYPIAPLVIGMILGPMVDENLRRALIGTQGSLLPFVTRPIAAVLLLLVVYSIVSQTGWYRRWRGARGQRLAEKTEQAI